MQQMRSCRCRKELFKILSLLFFENFSIKGFTLLQTASSTYDQIWFMILFEAIEMNIKSSTFI